MSILLILTGFFCILILIYNNFIQSCYIITPFSETRPIFKVLLSKPVIKCLLKFTPSFPSSKISASNAKESKSSINAWFILVLFVPLSNQMLLMRLKGKKNQPNRTTHLGMLEDHFKSLLKACLGQF